MMTRKKKYIMQNFLQLPDPCFVFLKKSIIIFATNMYNLLRKILFWFDAEEVHYFSMNMLVFFCKFSFLKNFLKKQFNPVGKNLSRKIFGLTFSNPVGLAAGFDKNAKYLN